jgi:hypothetical protein
MDNTQKQEKRTDSEPGALPCLNSNISTETNSDPLTGLAKLSTQHRKSAFILKESVHKLSEQFGIDYLGFLTLTFAQHITCPKEAQRRLNSLITHVIKPRYAEYLGVMERQKSGRIHYHFLVVLPVDIRTGFDFDAIKNHDYTSAGPDLRKEWSFWRTTAKKFGFGRTELLPVKSNIEAMAKYVGKYIAKHVEARQEQDKGVRLVRYSTGARAGTTRFQFHSEGSMEWRRKIKTFAQMIESATGHQCRDLAGITRAMGPRWAYKHRDFILSLP